MNVNQRKGIVRGGASGFAISLLVHVGAFVLAGLLVVFTVHHRQERQFDPPKPVDRPKMKLKKPKVKVKKSAKPTSSRIVTKVDRASMPEIQLPEMSGMGDGLVGGMGGGFDLMPDLTEFTTAFGGAVSVGNDLKGFFYNFNRDRKGRKIPMSPEQMEDLLYAYLKSGWKTSRIARYYRSPNAIFTPTICVPTVMSEIAPQAFGETTAEGYCWAVVYEGELVYPEDITFRFWGVGDKLMAVRVDGETVLICAYMNDVRSRFSTIWQTKDSKDNTYYFAEHRARPSDWITLKAGESKDIKVLMADLQGGLVYHILSVEVKGEEYPRTRAGTGPTFPVFRTSEIPRDMRDVIYADLYPGDTCLTNGPIFRDYDFSARGPVPSPSDKVVSEDRAGEATPRFRSWTLEGGETFQAKLVTSFGASVVLETKARRQKKYPIANLSAADREYLELENPPEFSINFMKSSSQILNPPTAPWTSGTQRPLQMFEYTFGVQVKQTSVSSPYNRELKVEYFAVGEEVDGDNYVLLERKESSFNPCEMEKRVFEFSGESIELRRMAYRDSAPVRGTKYGGYLVTITDKRGQVINYKSSHDFLYENLDRLRQLSPNNHFERNGIRTTPARPTEDSRGFGAVDGN